MVVQAGEKAQFHDLGFLRILTRKCIECFMDLQDLFVLDWRFDG